jgi:hypothetical protein
MTTPSEVERIAKGLSEAQRRYLTAEAKWREPTAYHGKVWMTFPRFNTHRVLQEKGLAERSGQITPLGLAVSQHLKENGDG